MAEHSAIEWTEATWNPITGCSIATPGCTHCYAMKLAGTRLRNHPSRAGLTKDTKNGPVWTGEVRMNDGHGGSIDFLTEPLRWRRPRKIFVCAHADLFHENVPDDWIDRVFAIMALAPWHTYQVLTKRSDRMLAYMTQATAPGRVFGLLGQLMPGKKGVGGAIEQAANLIVGRTALAMPHVWLGVSVEDQRRANQRVPDLLQTPAAVRWLSMEPLLGPVDLRHISTMRWRGAEVLNALNGVLEGMFGDYCPTRTPYLDWIVVGGESGPGARPMHPDWVRKIRDDCAATGVPFHFKQWGSWRVLGWEHARSKLLITKAGRLVQKKDADQHRDVKGQGLIEVERVSKKEAGRRLDGRTHDGVPA